MLGGFVRFSDGSEFDADKSEVCIEVDVDDAERWESWAARHGIDQSWRDVLADAGDGMYEHWWVVEGIIFESQWAGIAATDDVWDDLGMKELTQ